MDVCRNDDVVALIQKALPDIEQLIALKATDKEDGPHAGALEDDLGLLISNFLIASARIYGSTPRQGGGQDSGNRRGDKQIATVSIMPIRDNHVERELHLLDLTMEDYSILELCAPGIRPSECTARQRFVLKERRFADLIEHPSLFEGPRFVLSSFGKTLLAAARALCGEEAHTNRGPAKVLQFPSAKTKVVRRGRTPQPPNDAA